MQKLIQKTQLLHWRRLLDQPISGVQKELADDWKTCAIGERIQNDGLDFQSEKQLTFEAKLLGLDFAIAVNKNDTKRAYRILDIIENIPKVSKN